MSYLHERAHKRELRLESARKSTGIAASTLADQERNLLFSLRSAFVQVLQAKAGQTARENLTYWDRELDVNRKRLAAGDLAQVDLDRLELQRVQFEKRPGDRNRQLRAPPRYQILMLLDDRTGIDRFDVTGSYDFTDRVQPLEEFRNVALETRPDLREAMQNVDLAKTNHQLAIANGSTDPTFGLDLARNPPIPFYFGFSISIPVRIFDRNQGEKARTAIDIRRSERAQDAARAQVFSDVDSAYVTVESALICCGRTDKYLKAGEDARQSRSLITMAGLSSGLSERGKCVPCHAAELLNLIGSYLRRRPK